MADFDACVFDLGNVLVSFSHERMWRQLGAIVGLPPPAVKETLTADDGLRRYERGECSDEAVLDLLAARGGRPFDASAAYEAMSDIFAPIPGMLETVLAVKRSGAKVGLLSNTVRPHFEFLRRRMPELFAPFDAMTLSYEARAVKPEPAIYAAAAAALGVDARRAWFIDDLPENVAGAAAAGWRGTVFVGREPLRAELRAAGLLDPRA